MNNKPFISVSIKTFNESENIVKTIESVRIQLLDYPSKIIVADSLSTDNTQQLARDMGVTVVSLIDATDRSCGVGHQLGYLHSEGDYLLLIDGDMELEKGFIEHAVDYMDSHPDCAGVAGTVEMDAAVNYEFKSRNQRVGAIYPVGNCNHLGGGGLYRRSAIARVGYLTNRNLHAYEEAEMGFRLLSIGYKLHRIDTPFFKHTSYKLSDLMLLKNRWKTGYSMATGELLRCTWRKPYFLQAVKLVINEIVFAFYCCILILLSLLFGGRFFFFMLVPLFVFFLLKTIKNRSVFNGGLGLLNLTVRSLGLVKGLLIHMKDPRKPPRSKVIE